MMRKRTRPFLPASVAVALALVAPAGCLAPPTGGLGPEGQTTVGRPGARIVVGGRTLELRTATGAPIPDVSVLIAGKVYQARDGKLAIGDAGSREALKAGFVVLAPGYVPRRVAAGETDLALVPMGATRAATTLGAGGGALVLPERGLSLAIPGGLAAAGSKAGLAAYVPPRDAGEDAAARAEREAFLARRPGSADAACGAPLPCPPPTARLGLAMVVEGAVAGGEIRARYDVGAMARGWDGRDPAPWVADGAAWPEEAREAALAAAQIRRVFAAIDATGDPTWRAQLASAHGITFEGGVLTFPVKLGDKAFTDGYARVEVDGLALLGVRLEVTAISSGVNGSEVGLLGAAGLPGGTGPMLQPGTIRQPGLIANTGMELLADRLVAHIITHDGGSIITHDGASIITHDGASLRAPQSASIITHDGASIITHDGASIITHDGGSLIGQDGGSLIGQDGGSLIGLDGGSLVANVGGSLAGVVRLPEGLAAGPTGPGAKFRLLAYPEAPWAGTRVFGAHLGLNAAAVTTDAAGAYELRNLPVSLPKVVPIAVQDGLRLATIARAPREGRVQADLDAATTGVTLLVLRRAGLTGVQRVDMDGFKADVAWLRAQLTLPQAQDVVRRPYDVAAALVDGVFAAAGRVPAALPVPPAPPAPTPTAAPTAAAAVPLNINPMPQAWVTDPTVVLSPGYAPGPAVTNTKFSSPKGLAAGGGALIIADHVNNVVRMFGGTASPYFQDVAGQPGSFAFPPSSTGLGDTMWRPRWLVHDQGRNVVYMTEGDEGGGPNALNWIRTVSFSAGGVTLLAGDAAPGNTDGAGATARFDRPEGLALSPDGRFLYVAERLGHRVRKVDLANGGAVTTHAGTGTPGFADGPGDAATFKEPRGLAADGYGNLYVVDAGNHAVRRVTADGAVTTLVGEGTPGDAINQGTGTKLKDPVGLAYDPISGGLFIADAGNDRLVYVSLEPPFQAAAVTDGGTAAGGVRMTQPIHVAVIGRAVYVTMGSNHGVTKIRF